MTSVHRLWWALLRATLVAALAALGSGPAMAYESNYNPTPVGTIEVKELPAARLLQVEGEGDYFDTANGLFGRLFRYLKNNDLSMTVPVEADRRPARMRFFVERGHTGTLPSEQGGVAVLNRPAARVASIGIRGSYSQENFEQGAAELRKWLAAHPEWSAVGEPYAVYWNGPFTLWFLKRSEVHIPVALR